MATMTDEYPDIKRYAGRDPVFAAGMARVDVHLANARASAERARRRREEQARLERAYYDEYLLRRRLFRF